MAGVRGKNLSARADGVDGDGPTLPAKLAPDGLLIGYSLEEEAHRPVMGFRFGEAVEDENADEDRGTQWLRFDKCIYDRCIDGRNYFPKES